MSPLTAPHIVVVGSLNIDLVIKVPVIPKPGETVLGGEFATFPGGKGANQAVAAARLGGRVSMVGRVGRDSFGEQLLESLSREGVEISHVGVDTKHATGVALITVDHSGQNNIAVASGANYTLTKEHVISALGSIEQLDLLVMPLETPMETIETAAFLAKKRRAKILLNPAPAQPLTNDLLALIDVLVPNEHEAAQLTGFGFSGDEEAGHAAKELLDRGTGSVVLTLGARGALVLEKSGETVTYSRQDPFTVTVVDTTAAGDAFVAALAVGLGEGRSLTEAARFANAAGALTVTKPGAQPSLPKRSEVEDLLTTTKVMNGLRSNS